MLHTVHLNLFGRNVQVRTAYLLLTLMIIGAALRLYKITAMGLWLDELHSMNGADPDKTLREVYEYAKSDQPPVLFFMLNKWLRLLPFNDFYGRLLTALFGIAGIAGAFFLGKEYKDERLGLITAFITTFNYFHIDFSREIRFYPIVFLFSSLSYLFFLRSVRENGWRNFVAYAIFTGLLLNTHYFGLVVFASQCIIFIGILIWYKRTTKLIVSGLISGAVAALSISHWLPMIFADLQITEFHVQPVPFYFPIVFIWVYFKDIVTCLIVTALGFLYLRKVVSDIRAKDFSIEQFIIIGWLGIGFLIPLLYSVLRIPLLTFKYSVITLPALFLMIGTGFLTIRNNVLKTAILTTWILALFINMAFLKKMYDRPYEYWRDAAVQIMRESRDNQVIFGKLAWYNAYYFKTLHYDQHLPEDQRFCDFTGLMNKADAVWILVHTRYPDEGLSTEQQKQLDEQFVFVKQIEFNEAYAKLYERKSATRGAPR